MSNTPDRLNIQNLIQSRRAIAQQQAVRWKSLNFVFILASVLGGALATLIAALAAALGGAALKGGGTLAWQLICAVVAVFSFIATTASGLSQQLGVTEKLSQSSACAGKLLALEMALSLDSQPLEEITRELSSLLSEYSAVLT